jgi:hypothetical protein
LVEQIADGQVQQFEPLRLGLPYCLVSVHAHLLARPGTIAGLDHSIIGGMEIAKMSGFGSVFKSLSKQASYGKPSQA